MAEKEIESSILTKTELSLRQAYGRTYLIENRHTKWQIIVMLYLTQTVILGIGLRRVPTITYVDIQLNGHTNVDVLLVEDTYPCRSSAAAVVVSSLHFILDIPT